MKKNTQVGASHAQVKLMDAIGNAIMRHTTISPMTEEDIISVMGFATGCAIGQARSRKDRRLLRETAIANIDYGLDQIRSQGAGLIMPPGQIIQ